MSYYGYRIWECFYLDIHPPRLRYAPHFTFFSQTFSYPQVKFLAFFLLSLKILFLFPIDVIQSSLFAKHIALAFIYTTNLWFSSNVILAKISTLQCCRCRKRGFVPVKYFTRHLNGLYIDNTVICVSASFYLLSFWDIYQPHFPSYTRTKQAITKDND